MSDDHVHTHTVGFVVPRQVDTEGSPRPPLDWRERARALGLDPCCLIEDVHRSTTAEVRWAVYGRAAV